MYITQELRSLRSLLSLKQTASIIGTCPTTIRRYASSGRLASIRVGNRLKFDPDVVADFLDSRSSK